MCRNCPTVILLHTHFNKNFSSLGFYSQSKKPWRKGTAHLHGSTVLSLLLKSCSSFLFSQVCPASESHSQAPWSSQNIIFGFPPIMVTDLEALASCKTGFFCCIWREFWKLHVWHIDRTDFGVGWLRWGGIGRSRYVAGAVPDNHNSCLLFLLNPWEQ